MSTQPELTADEKALLGRSMQLLWASICEDQYARNAEPSNQSDFLNLSIKLQDSGLIHDPMVWEKS